MDHHHQHNRQASSKIGQQPPSSSVLDQDHQRGATTLDQRRQSDVNESLQLRGGDELISELYVWGNDYYGQLGVGSEKVIHNLPKICSFNIVISDVSCGEEHTVFVQSDGGYVYAMGSNSEGRLGTGNTELRSCNIPTLVEGLINIRKVSCGTSHTLALNDDGEAYAWGQAFYGALGIKPNAQGALENVFSPRVIPQEAFGNEVIKDLQAGSRHSIFVTQGNRIYGCGDANQGQLGLGDANRDRVIEPTLVMANLKGMSIHQVSCGKYHTMLLTNNPREGNRRELWACGANNFGQIGNNSNQNQFSPVRVDPRPPEDKMSQNGRSHNFKQVSTWHASAAVTEEGIMYVWGAGIFGEFKRPRKVKLQNNIKVQSVNVGGSFIVIVDRDGKLVVWGSNSNGEIGVGDSKVRNHPTRLETIDDKLISKVGVGGSFAFAIGKTSTRMENSIFDDGAANERSQISGIGRDGASNILNDEVAKERNNRSINSLEEQLQQIALHSDSKIKRRQDSEDNRQQRPQDRSVGNYSHHQQEINRVSLKHQNKAQSDPIPGPIENVSQLKEQVAYLKQVIEEKERAIKNLNEQTEKKHDEYSEKLHKFKEMQDKEMIISNKLRDENTLLRKEVDQLREENIEIKQQLNALKRAEPLPPPIYSRQDSGNALTSGQQQPPTQSSSNYHQRSHQALRGGVTGPSGTTNSVPEPATSYSQKQGVQEPPHSYSALNDDLNQRQPATGAESNNYRRDIEMFGGIVSGQYRREEVGQEVHHRPPLQRDYEHQAANSTTPDNNRHYGGLGARDTTYHHQHRVSVDIDNLDRSPDSTAKKQHDFLRQSHNDIQQDMERRKDIMQSSSDHGSQLLQSRGASKEYNYALENNHQRRISQIKSTVYGGGAAEDDAAGKDTFRVTNGDGYQDQNAQNAQQRHSMPPTSSGNFNGANRMEQQQNSQSRFDAAAAYTRERIGSGRHQQQQQESSDQNQLVLRNSSSSTGFYQPSSKYARVGATSADFQADRSNPGAIESDTRYNMHFKEQQQRKDNTPDMTNSAAFNPNKRSVTPSAAPLWSSFDGPLNADQQTRVSQQHEAFDRHKQPNEYYQDRSSYSRDDKRPGGASRYEPERPGQIMPSQSHHQREASDQIHSHHYEQQPLYSKQRPSSCNGVGSSSNGNREPPMLYHTHNNLQSIKYENIMGSSDGFSRGGTTADQKQNMQYGAKESSPQQLSNKPPSHISDLYQPKMPVSAQNEDKRGYTSSFTAGAAGSASYQAHQTATVDRTYTSNIGTGKASGEVTTSTIDAIVSRPPTYNSKADPDFSQRQSNEPISSKENPASNYHRMQSASAGQSSYAMGSGLNVSSSFTQQHQPLPSKYQYNNINSENINMDQAQQQKSSEVDNHNIASKQYSMAMSMNTNGRLAPERTSSFSGSTTAGAHSNLLNPLLTNASDINASSTLPKGRSPFTAHQLNEQKPPAYAGASSFTPQGSGRRSGSLMEMSSTLGGAHKNTGGGEDIRAKLARYKKEREDFEVIRQQFRQKNEQLSNSGVLPPSGKATAGGGAYTENTPNADKQQYPKLAMGAVADLDHGSAENKHKTNIFAAENGSSASIKSSQQVLGFQAHVVKAGGSPAFGQPAEQQHHTRTEY